MNSLKKTYPCNRFAILLTILVWLAFACSGVPITSPATQTPSASFTPAPQVQKTSRSPAPAKSSANPIATPLAWKATYSPTLSPTYSASGSIFPFLGTYPDGVRWPGADWPKASPEVNGLDPARLTALVEAVPKRTPGLLSLLVIHEGSLILEKDFSTRGIMMQRREIYSVTKSFIATLIGIAINQGYLSGTESHVLDYFPGREIRNISPEKEVMTLENLLTMTSGLDWTEGDQALHELYQSPDWTQYMLDLPMIDPPGERFNYCTGCSHLLSAILEQATSMNTLDFARRYLFEPIGISKVEWKTDPSGTPTGGWGLQITPSDMARLGYLYLRKGVWNGRQVVSSSWVEASTAPHVQAEDKLSYGYQWWVRPSIKGYAAIGVEGQMVAVIPEKDLVVVFISEYGNSEVLFGLIEEYFNQNSTES